MKTEYQVTYYTEHAPAFGLDMFDDELEALTYAFTLIDEKKDQIKVTLIEDTAPVKVIWESPQHFMNVNTGQVNTYDGWEYKDERTGKIRNAVDDEQVVPVVRNDSGEWIEA